MSEQGSETGWRIEVASEADMPACFAVRHRVFVVEQGVPADLERDDEDARATHWLVREGERVLGTARARAVDHVVPRDEPAPRGAGAERVAKAERVAVLAEARGSGVGRALMDEIERSASAEGFRAVFLHAQAAALPFYRALGYRSEGEAFEEAGIPHQAMRKSF